MMLWNCQSRVLGCVTIVTYPSHTKRKVSKAAIAKEIKDQKVQVYRSTKILLIILAVPKLLMKNPGNICFEAS